MVTTMPTMSMVVSTRKMSPGSLLLPDRWLVAWHKLELGLSRLLGCLIVKMRICGYMRI